MIETYTYPIIRLSRIWSSLRGWPLTNLNTIPFLNEAMTGTPKPLEFKANKFL